MMKTGSSQKKRFPGFTAPRAHPHPQAKCHYVVWKEVGAGGAVCLCWSPSHIRLQAGWAEASQQSCFTMFQESEGDLRVEKGVSKEAGSPGRRLGRWER